MKSEFKVFARVCRDAGAFAEQMSPIHWRITGTNDTVDFWPTGQGGSKFWVHGTPGPAKYGTVHDAIASVIRDYQRPQPKPAATASKNSNATANVMLISDDDWRTILCLLEESAQRDEHERPGELSDHRILLGYLQSAEEDGMDIIRRNRSGCAERTVR